MTGLALQQRDNAAHGIYDPERFKNRRSVIASQEVGFRDAPRPDIGTVSG
jgi:hypothetical protein